MENITEDQIYEMIKSAYQSGKPIELDGVCISFYTNHYQNLSKNDEGKVIIKSPIKIINSKLSNVSFSNVIFIENVSFLNSEFIGQADFISAKFSKDADFKNTSFTWYPRFTEAEFNGNTCFDNSIFRTEGAADFQNAKFNRKVSFIGADFFDSSLFNGAYFQEAHFAGARGQPDFRESVFNTIFLTEDKSKPINSELYFYKAHFLQSIDLRGLKFSNFPSFVNSQFHDQVLFKGSEFTGAVNFNKTIFIKDADFSEALFNKRADFSETNFNKGASFNKALFSETSNFTAACFKESADFSEARFGEADADFGATQFIGPANFKGASFNGDIFFIGSTFGNYFDLTSTKYKTLYIRSKSLKKSRYPLKASEGLFSDSKLFFDENFGDTTYLLMIENLKKIGFFEDADDCYYCYRIARRRNLQWYYKFFDYLLMMFYGYGVKPIYPLVWSVIILLSFGFIYAALGPFLGFDKTISFIEALNMSSTTFLSGAKLVESFNPPATHYWLFNIEKLLGSLFLALFIISLGKTVIR